MGHAIMQIQIIEIWKGGCPDEHGGYPYCRGMAHGSLDDGVEAVGEDAGLHGLGLLLVGEGADLDVEKLVLGLVAYGYGVALLLE